MIVLLVRWTLFFTKGEFYAEKWKKKFYPGNRTDF